MNQEGFDNIIKDKLKGYNAEFPNTDVWDAFEHASVKIENKISTEEQFDIEIKDALADQKINYNGSHWKIMKAQLKISEERRRTIYISKILEIAAVFLIFITAFKWPVYKNPAHLEKTNIITNKSEYASQFKPILKLENKKASFASVSNNVQNISITLKVEINKPNLEANDLSTAIMVTNDLDITQSESLITEKQTLNIVSPADDQNILNDKSEVVIANDKSLITSEENESLQNIDVSDSSNSDLASLPTLNNKNLSSEFPMMVPMDFVQPKAKSKYYLGSIASADVNLINTPFDKVYSIRSYHKEALNNSIGLTISKKKGLVELETGAIYAKRAYQPEEIRERLENEFFFTEKTFNKIEFDVLNLPINIKYHFINQPKWSAYIVAGAAVNLIMNAKYAIREIQTLNRPAPGEYLNSESRLQEKPFIKGLLNKDNLNDNYFATLGFGFGIEKKISNATSIYLQPSYQRQVLSGDIGIGPNKDKIHTSSLAFGVKTALN